MQFLLKEPSRPRMVWYLLKELLLSQNLAKRKTRKHGKIRKIWLPKIVQIGRGLEKKY